jgi:hypothetical protein
MVNHFFCSKTVVAINVRLGTMQMPTMFVKLVITLAHSVIQEKITVINA